MRVLKLGAGVAVIYAAALGFLPLFAGPTYEYALGTGIVLPGLAAVCMALSKPERSLEPLQVGRRGLYFGLALALLVYLVALLHGLRAGFCEALAGSGFYWLGPGAGMLLAGLWGALVNVLCHTMHGKLATLARVALAFGLPLFSAAISGARFYTSPMVFAFDPFVGFFAGTLYDTVITGQDRLISYRLGSLASVVVALACLRHCFKDPGRRLGLRRARWRRDWIFVGGVAATASLGVTLAGPSLGHYQTSASISQALGQYEQGQRCELVYATGLLKRDAQLLLKECEAHVKAVEHFFGATGPERIRVFVFASSEQKAWLMGAGTTYIAKPWREEIYIQTAGFPHPVLGHELAHVIAGSFAQGPFKVAGPLGGWVPDPGRIEGFAVAAAPAEDTDLSLFEWSAAMLELGLLPPLTDTFKLSFFGRNSALSYTVAGAFVRFLYDNYGSLALRRWYAGEELSRVTGGASLAALEQAFTAFLRQNKLSEQALRTAKQRFERPSVFGRSCPHEVDEMEQQAAIALASNDPEGGAKLFQAVLELDPHDFGARLELGACKFRQNDLEGASAHYAGLALNAMHGPLEQSLAKQRWGDAELSRGRGEVAKRLYDEASSSLVDENQLRTLDVKRYAAERIAADPESEAGLAAAAIVSLLIGDPEQGPDATETGARLASWAARATNPSFAYYLLGKNLLTRGRYRQAQAALKLALKSDFELPRVRTEALRAFVVTACALGQAEQARQPLAEYLAEARTAAARRAGFARFADRCGVPRTTP